MTETDDGELVEIQKGVIQFDPVNGLLSCVVLYKDNKV